MVSLTRSLELLLGYLSPQLVSMSQHRVRDGRADTGAGHDTSGDRHCLGFSSGFCNRHWNEAIGIHEPSLDKVVVCANGFESITISVSGVGKPNNVTLGSMTINDPAFCDDGQEDPGRSHSVRRIARRGKPPKLLCATGKVASGGTENDNNNTMSNSHNERQCSSQHTLFCCVLLLRNAS